MAALQRQCTRDPLSALAKGDVITPSHTGAAERKTMLMQYENLPRKRLLYSRVSMGGTIGFVFL